MRDWCKLFVGLIASDCWAMTVVVDVRFSNLYFFILLVLLHRK